jgi:hypothetical protein
MSGGAGSMSSGHVWSLAATVVGLQRVGLQSAEVAMYELTASASQTPDRMAWLQRAYQALQNPTFTVEAVAEWPKPSSDPSWAPWCLAAFAATVPDALARHQALGVPADIALASLNDLRRWTELWHRRRGSWGLGETTWLPRHWAGGLLELGRLQFEPGRWNGPEQQVGKHLLRPGDRVVHVHIPEGPALDHAVCSASFARASTIIPQVWPDCVGVPLTCHSWLFDPWLSEVLPATANILQFASQWWHCPGWEADTSLTRYVFDRDDVTSEMTDLPAKTSLQRAALSHLRNGGSWVAGTGVRPWPWNCDPLPVTKATL